MKILSSPEMVKVDKIAMLPFVRYVVPEDVARSIGEKLAQQKPPIEFTCSHFSPFERRYGGQEGAGKKIALFRHSAWGDQLMTTAVVRALMSVRPEVRVDVYCSATVLSMWEGVTRAYPSPMPFDGIRCYDYHVFYEGMLENNSEPDQNNAIDDMLAFMGIDPETIPSPLKCPLVVARDEDYAETHKLGVKLNKPYVLIQLQASNPNRTYPPRQTAEVIRLILDKWKDMQVILVGQDKENKWQDGISTVTNRRGFVNLVNKLEEFRSIIPLVKHAAAVICPDSSVGHLAAAFPTVPTVSLWGLFHPNDRVKHYGNHFPIFNDGVCPYAPCHNHDFKLPQVKCKDAKNAIVGEQQYCCALRSISAKQILSTLESAMSTSEPMATGVTQKWKE